jgi:hypothetical protein
LQHNEQGSLLLKQKYVLPSTLKNALAFYNDSSTTLAKFWSQSYDRELQRQRCKNYNETNILLRF